MVTNLKIALAQLNPLVGDVSGNVKKLLKVRSELNNHVDSLILKEYPKINQFISDVFRLGFD